MNRRNFLQLAALAIAGQAAERVFPFRVYSIPKNIVAPKIDLDGRCLTIEMVRAAVKQFEDNVGMDQRLFGLPGSMPTGLTHSGKYIGLARSPYPGMLSTPTIY